MSGTIPHPHAVVLRDPPWSSHPEELPWGTPVIEAFADPSTGSGPAAGALLGDRPRGVTVAVYVPGFVYERVPALPSTTPPSANSHLNRSATPSGA